ncbi:MAG: hypothetical protein Q8O52_26355 [Sulfuritalea sp.]|nr:hypothetical protein [Sulfuritalea sp.]
MSAARPDKGERPVIPVCKIVACLHEIAAGHGAVDGFTKGIASNALAIVEDMEEDGITELGLRYFLLFADEIVLVGNVSLHTYLQDGAPDCEICAALMKRMRQT